MRVLPSHKRDMFVNRASVLSQNRQLAPSIARGFLQCGSTPARRSIHMQMQAGKAIHGKTIVVTGSNQGIGLEVNSHQHSYMMSLV